jgi:predicted Zn-dependent protease
VRFTLTAALTALLAAACAPTPAFDPATGRISGAPVSPLLEEKGERLFERYKKKRNVSTNPSHRKRVQRVVDRVAKVVPAPAGEKWEVVVFDEKKPNAFALPGGKIGVHTGILPIAKNDAGLATVISHEMAHVTLNHAQAKLNRASGLTVGAILLDTVLASQGVPGMTRVVAAGAYGIGAGTGMMLPYSRSSEREADQLGMLYMARAGYDPAEAIAVWRRFAAWRKREGKRTAPEFLRSHPLDDSRIRQLEKYLPVAQKEYRR